jgi:nickel superoxide dismutase
MKTSLKVISSMMLVMLTANLVQSHCQVPCGIYGDATRIDLMREHITTIEKSMNQIIELSKNPAANMNQLVRWINNKDKHADDFTEIVTYYFLTQRIKIAEPADKQAFADYQQKLTYLHQMMVFSMKCKQTTDLSNVQALSKLLDQFQDIYFTAEDKEHMKQHHN